MRGRNGPDHEWQERTREIRSAARKGRDAIDIADAYQLCLAVLGGMITPGLHGAELRFADPTASRAIYHQLDTVASRFGTERSPDRDLTIAW